MNVTLQALNAFVIDQVVRIQLRHQFVMPFFSYRNVR